MAGAVAFVFGLCALSFAAGCVVTAVMLRRSDPADEVPQPVAPPESAQVPVQVPAEKSLLRRPPDDFVAKPIHRNPVVSRPALVTLELEDTDPAPAALALAPDPTFTDVVDPRPVPTPVLVDVPAVEQPVPSGERSLHAQSKSLPSNGRTPWGKVEPVTLRSLHAEQAVLLKAACGVPSREWAEQPITLRAVDHAEPLAVTPEPIALSHDEPEPVTVEETARLPEPQAEIVAPERVAPPRLPITGPNFPVARNGKRREIRLELVAPVVEPDLIGSEATGSEVEQAGPEAVPAVESDLTGPEVEPVELLPEPAVLDGKAVLDGETVLDVEPVAVVPESETMFASRSGLVTDPVIDDVEAVVPEQGTKAAPVVPRQHVVVANDEFRKRYLRTFEAARRRSNH